MSNAKYDSSSIKEERHLDDIIDSIRGIIKQHDPLKGASDNSDNINIELDDHDEHLQDSADEPLELDRIDVNDQNNQELISNDTLSEIKLLINKFNEQVKSSQQNTNNVLQNNMLEVMRPIIKEWLDNNLPKMVEQILQDELKKIIES